METLAREALWILDFVGKAFLHILPYLAVSVPLAVILKRSGASRRIEGALRGNPVVAVVLATLVGAVSPFCSCGVVPVVAALLTGGVPLAPVMAFWLASPSMDPEIFFLSAGAVGWDLAIWRLAATFVMSLAGGFITLALERSGALGKDLVRLAPAARGAVGSAARPQAPAARVGARTTIPVALYAAPRGTGCGPQCGCSRGLGRGLGVRVRLRRAAPAHCAGHRYRRGSRGTPDRSCSGWPRTWESPSCWKP